MIKNIFKTAFKYLWKNRIYNFINILGLTVSITSILIILVYIGNEQKYDIQINNRNKIYRMGTNWATMPSFIGHFLKDESGYIDDVTRVKMEEHEISYNNEVFLMDDIAMADASFFKVFNFKFLLGNQENALERIHSIVLTQREAERIFGKANPLNQTILLKNKYPFTITGVVENPDYFHLPFTAIATLESLKELADPEILEQKDGWSYLTYIVGKPSYTGLQTEKMVNKKLYEFGEYKNVKFHLTSLKDLYFAAPLYYEGSTRHGSKTVLFILFSIALLLFILAGINFINLTNSRTNIRLKEVGIKKLIGSPKSTLIIQFLVESILLLFIALGFSLLLVKMVEPLFCNLVNKIIDFSAIYSLFNLLIIGFLIILIGIITGLFPAISINSVQSISLIKNKMDRFSQKTIFSKSLITFQYVISIILIAGTLIIVKQLRYLKNKDLGFSPEQIVCIELNDDLKAQQNTFKNELLQIPGVLQAAYSGNRMGNDWGNWLNEMDGDGKSFKVNCVEPGYFDLMGIKLKEGRIFREDEMDKGYMINETAVKQYDIKNPLEKTMERDGKIYPIIGVMKDFNFQSPQYPIEPVLFYFRDNRYNLINIKINAANAKEVIGNIEKVWEKFSPSHVLTYNFQDDLYDKQYKSAEQFSTLVGIGGAIAIIIACLGILGLSISLAEQKIKEIGIRKVNGAKVSEILSMLNKDFIKWVTIAFVIATPIAYYAMNKWLENFAYKTALSWWIFALAGVLALGIALLTVSWQSWRAATRNPVEALRYE
ncbi:MAG: ABC transporter permease [Prolixibacteraceae bacterium]|nr:ABC transporter permease [Prolixibacteraceae bacterium]